VSDLDFSAMRAAMVSNQLRTNAVSNPLVVAAVEAVAREKFVPADRLALAYVDIPVPLGGGRSLNAPLVTARLITEAGLKKGDRVLLVGAATGYAAALIAELVGSVTALEEDAALFEKARLNLGGDDRVTLAKGPLNAGWAAGGPYDAVIIDGAVEAVSDALWAQLVAGGVLATGVVDQSVTRLAIGRAAGNGHGLFAFADAETTILPGFAKPRGCSF
jgi:protein-L-isoaspartate(D-aspartate) O-methyltransferase